MALTPEQIERLRSRVNIPNSSADVSAKNSQWLANLRQQQKQKQDVEEYKKTPKGQSFLQNLGNVGIGVVKGVVSTATGISSLGERMLRGGTKLVLPKSAEQKLGIEDKMEETSAEQLISKELRTPANTAQKIGFFGEQLGEFLIPAGLIGKIGKTAETVIKTALGGGKIGSIAGLAGKAIAGGAGFAGTSALQEGEVEGSDFTTGAIIEGVAPILGKMFKPIAEHINLLPNRFIRSALGRKKAEVLKDLKDGKDALSEYFLKNKPASSLNQIAVDSQKAIEDLSGRISTNINNAVRKSGEKATVGRNMWLDSVLKMPESKNALLNRADIQEVIERLVPQSKKFLQNSSLSLEESNKLRQLLDRTLGDRGFLADKLPNDKQVLRNASNALREIVKTKAPEGTRGMFDELSKEITLNNTVLDRIASRSGNELINIGDLIVGGAFGAFGGGLGGSILAAATLRILRSTPFKIGSAKTLEFINANAAKLEKLSPQIRATIIKAIDNASDSSDNENVQE